jgi:CheY-like chemotaxis protein/anti-sigma regulatory factor (Ser/Thr protein kinase)
VVTDTVDISRINSNQCKVINTNTNIQSITTSVIEDLKELAEEKGLPLELNIDIDKKNLEVETDKNKLERILWQIINNAIRFTKTGKISINVSIENDFINYRIKDTGKGIPQDMHSNIFKPFIQINDSSVEAVKGNGFGLPIAKAYTELLGGKIKIISEVGIGTTIHFTIPFKGINKIATKSNESKKQTNSKKTILLAEDDEINAYLIERIFSKYNIHLITTTNGKEAINIFRQRESEIDMVLLDLRMPIMNGFEAISIIREINSEIPVIAYTAYCSKSEVSEIMDAGFDDYISKPINKEKLLKIVFTEH